MIKELGMYTIKFKDGSEKELESLVGADLRNADLKNVDLTHAKLAYANLTDADLKGADLRGVSLLDTNLTRANLIGADLRHTSLVGADLTGANLDYAAWSLWCGTAYSSIKVDNKLKAQLLYHAFILGGNIDDRLKPTTDMIEAIAEYFHRYEEVEKLK